MRDTIEEQDNILYGAGAMDAMDGGSAAEQELFGTGAFDAMDVGGTQPDFGAGAMDSMDDAVAYSPDAKINESTGEEETFWDNVGDWIGAMDPFNQMQRIMKGEVEDTPSSYAKSIAPPVTAAYYSGKDAVGALGEMTGLMPEDSAAQMRQDANDYFDNTGSPDAMRAVGLVGSMAVPGSALFKGARALGSGKAASAIIAEIGVAGILPHDMENLSSMIPEDDMPAAVTHFRSIMATNPNDPDYVNVVRNGVEGLVALGVLSSAIPMIVKGTKMSKSAKDSIIKGSKEVGNRVGESEVMHTEGMKSVIAATEKVVVEPFNKVNDAIKKNLRRLKQSTVSPMEPLVRAGVDITETKVNTGQIRDVQGRVTHEGVPAYADDFQISTVADTSDSHVLSPMLDGATNQTTKTARMAVFARYMRAMDVAETNKMRITTYKRDMADYNHEYTMWETGRAKKKPTLPVKRELIKSGWKGHDIKADAAFVKEVQSGKHELSGEVLTTAERFVKQNGALLDFGAAGGAFEKGWVANAKKFNPHHVSFAKGVDDILDEDSFFGARVDKAGKSTAGRQPMSKRGTDSEEQLMDFLTAQAANKDAIIKNTITNRHMNDMAAQLKKLGDDGTAAAAAKDAERLAKWEAKPKGKRPKNKPAKIKPKPQHEGVTFTGAPGKIELAADAQRRMKGENGIYAKYFDADTGDVAYMRFDTKKGPGGKEVLSDAGRAMKDAIETYTPTQMSQGWRVGKWLARRKSAFITLNPAFYMIRQPLRDMWGTAIMSNTGKIGAAKRGDKMKAWSQASKEVREAQGYTAKVDAMEQNFGMIPIFSYLDEIVRNIRRTDDFRANKAEGIAAGANFSETKDMFDGALEMADASKYYAKKHGINDLGATHKSFVSIAMESKLLEKNRKLASGMENMMRNREYRTMRNTKNADGTPTYTALEAANAAREIGIDFAVRGTSDTIAKLAAVTPFFNPALQGMKRAADILTDPAKLQKAAMTLTPLAVGMWTLNKDNTTYQNIPYEEKLMFMHIPLYDSKDTGETVFFKWPLPFELGMMLMGAPTMVLDEMYRDNPEGTRDLAETIAFAGDAAFVAAMTASPINQGSGSLNLPIGVNMAADMALGTKGFSGQQIIPRGTEEMSPYLQAYESTGPAYTLMGKEVGQSPEHVKMVAEEFLGTTAAMAAGLADAVIAASSEDWDVDMSSELSKVPLLGGLFSKEAAQSRDVNRVYDLFEDEGKPAKGKVSASEGGSHLPLSYIDVNDEDRFNAELQPEFESIMSQASEQKKDYNMAKQNKAMSPKELRSMKQQQTAIRNESAKAVLEARKSIKGN